MQGRGHPGRADTYRKALQSFTSAMAYTREAVERVTIPHAGKELAAWYMRAAGDGPKPVVIYCNGLDSTKELLWLSGLPKALAARGISSLCVDQPGTGEALRLQSLYATHESERWASAWVDWLETQPDADSGALGMTGISLGGCAEQWRSSARRGRCLGREP
jgi:predicted alpha/beta-fold hydrolase